MRVHGTSAEDFDAAREAFVSSYLRAHPEEASTLGLRAYDARLSSLEEEALADEAAAARAFLRATSALEPEGLSVDDRLELRALTRHARFRARWLEELEGPLRSLEPAFHTHAMLAHHATRSHDGASWEALADRLAAVPSHLAAHAARLEEGVARGFVPDAALTTWVVEGSLPAAADWLLRVASLAPVEGAHGPLRDRVAALAAEAARGARAHGAFLRSTLLPRARDAFALGPDEVRRRLDEQLDLRADPEDLVREAEERLRDAQSELVRAADRSARARGGHAADLASAARVVVDLFGRGLRDASEIIPLYQGLTDRALAFVRERKLFRVPDDLDLEVIPLPAGVAHGTAATNWPAPLVDPTGRARVAVALSPSMHSRPAAANLAVHEGVPGHSLQSVLFQRGASVGRGEARVARFLCVVDDEAFAQGYFAPMLNVEGFAVWAEELMLGEGYLDVDETVCALGSRAIRAARVVVDLSLHARGWSRGEASAFLERETGMPRAWCEAQTLRYTRIPLQASTYDLGRIEIERAARAERSRLGGAFDLAAFHDRLLAHGPLPPREIAEAIAEAASRPSAPERD